MPHHAMLSTLTLAVVVAVPAPRAGAVPVFLSEPDCTGIAPDSAAAQAAAGLGDIMQRCPTGAMPAGGAALAVAVPVAGTVMPTPARFDFPPAGATRPAREPGLLALLLAGAMAMLLTGGRRRRGRPAPWLAKRLR